MKNVEFPFYTPPVGKLDWLDDYYAPAVGFPWYCLNQADGVVLQANWPLLVPQQRAKVLRSGITQIGFTITQVVVSGTNTAVCTYQTATLEDTVAAALLEDAKVHNEPTDPETPSYSSWRTMTVPAGGMGGVTEGTWGITAIDTGARTVTISGTGWTNGTVGSLSIDCAFYPHRVADTEATPTLKARLYRVTGRSLIMPGDSLGEIFAGLRRRDRGQLHKHDSEIAKWPERDAPGAAAQFNAGGTHTENRTVHVGTPITDGVSGTPRGGKTTDPRGLGAYLYVWGGIYLP